MSLESFRDELSARYLKNRRTGINLALAAEREGGVIEPRVHAVGIGTREGTDQPAVIVYVTRKLPMADLAPKDRIPPSSEGISTDVVVSAIPKLASCSDDRTSKHRPLIGGIAVARQGGPTGTLGCFVRSTRVADPASATYLLSNSHVLAPQEGTVEGIPVHQPSDGDRVARVARATRLTISKPIHADAAIARIDDRDNFKNIICSIGAVTGIQEPSKTTIAVKHGQKTGLTKGAISAVGLDQIVRDPFRNVDLTFKNLFRVDVSPDDDVVALAGDSGSLVVADGTSQALGILVGADDFGGFYVANPMAEVLSALDIEVLIP